MQPCKQCGAHSEDGQRFCYNCGARLEPSYAPPAPPAPNIPAPPPQAPLQYGGQQQYNQYGQPPSQVIPNSTLAIASLVSGILAWTILPFLGAFAAIITGHMARGEIRTAGGNLSGDGLAVIGLVLGYAQMALLTLFFCFFLFIFAAALI